LTNWARENQFAMITRGGASVGSELQSVWSRWSALEKSPLLKTSAISCNAAVSFGFIFAVDTAAGFCPVVGGEAMGTCEKSCPEKRDAISEKHKLNTRQLIFIPENLISFDRNFLIG
jgi:hypothetical protein